MPFCESAHCQFSSCASPGNSSFLPFTSNSRIRLVLFKKSSRVLTIPRTFFLSAASACSTNQRISVGFSSPYFGERGKRLNRFFPAARCCKPQYLPAIQYSSLFFAYFLRFCCLSVGGPRTRTFTPGSRFASSSPEGESYARKSG